MAYDPIFLPIVAYQKMQQQKITRAEVSIAFNSKILESSDIPSATQGITHLPSKTIGCVYK